MHLTNLALLLAAPSAPANSPTVDDQPITGIDTTGIIAWLVSNILPLVIVGIGIWAATKAKSGETSKVLTAILIVCISAVVIASAGSLHFFGSAMVHTIFK